MASLFFLPKNDKIKKEEKIKLKITPEKDKINFNDFNSILFLSEYQGNEKNLSEISNKGNNFELSNSNNEKEKKFSTDTIKFSISSKKCITKELIETLEKDSIEINKNGKMPQLIKKGSKNGSNKTHYLPKITQNFMLQIEMLTQEKNNEIIKDRNILFEENINDCEYQLKFIENSLHNILPKTYKKSQLTNNSYNKGKIVIPFHYPTKFYINKNNYNSLFCKNEIKDNNNYPFVSPFNANIIKNNNNKNRINYQIHSLKLNNSKCFKWECKFCNNNNMGNYKTCFNCKKNKKAKF